MDAPWKLSALLLLVLCASCSVRPSRPLHGTVFRPPRKVVSFTLTDQFGRAFHFNGLAGRAVVLFFGYAHCRDVCPQTLRTLALARRRAGLHDTGLAIVFVTVDPGRDSPPVLRAFLRHIGVRASALTGSTAQLRPVYQQFGVWAGKGHPITHTDAVYLIDAGGYLREILDADAPVAAIAADYKTIVAAGAPAVH